MSEEMSAAAAGGEPQGAKLLLRLPSLPPGVLWLIARRAGLRSRRVCRALRDAYGPLDCSVRLKGVPKVDALMDILTVDCKNLSTMTSLRVGIPWSAVQDLAGLLKQIPLSAPRLSALTLSGCAVVTGASLESSLQHLAPLGPSLTALQLHLHASGRRLQPCSFLAPLTNLRTLALSCAESSPPTTQAWLQALCALPRLVDLSLFDPKGTERCSPSSWVVGLATAVPQLTSLSLGLLHDWDPPTVEAFRAGFTALRALAVSAASWNPSVIDALAAVREQRSALTGVRLSVVGSRWPPAQGEEDALQRLPGVQVAGLTARGKWGTPRLAELLAETLEAQKGLTRLQVACYEALPPAFLREATLRALGTTLVELDLQMQWHLDPLSLLSRVAQLQRLRALRLHRQERVNAWPAAATAALGALTRLRELALTEETLPAGLLEGLSALTALRELRLRETVADQDGATRDLDFEYLVPHRVHLTRLVLDGVKGVAGPGLAELQHLTGLRRLELAGMPDVAGANLHLFLLPLPAGLDCVKVVGMGVTQEGRKAVEAAAKRQGCRARVVLRDPLRAHLLPEMAWQVHALPMMAGPQAVFV